MHFTLHGMYSAFRRQGLAMYVVQTSLKLGTIFLGVGLYVCNITPSFAEYYYSAGIN